MSEEFLDLDSLFDWNVKQLFLYLIAEYVTPANVSGEIKSKENN
jgi:hypothetical protein